MPQKHWKSTPLKISTVNRTSTDGKPSFAACGFEVYLIQFSQRRMETVLQTRVRRTHLGIRYDIYVNGSYRGTAQTAKEIEPLISKIESALA